jgi:hypothetical protein
MQTSQMRELRVVSRIQGFFTRRIIDLAKRGPKSAAELGTRPLATVSSFDENKPPEPPDYLGDAEAETWREIVGALPQNWFPRETHGILAAYCGHVGAANFIHTLIEKCLQCENSDVDIKLYGKLLGMQARETSMMIHLARTMRLTQQSTIDPKTGGRQKDKHRHSTPPWGHRPPWIE